MSEQDDQALRFLLSLPIVRKFEVGDFLNRGEVAYLHSDGRIYARPEKIKDRTPMDMDALMERRREAQSSGS